MIREAYGASQKREAVNVRDLLNTLTLNVITRIAFGKKFFGPDVEVDEKSKAHQAWVQILPEITTRFTQILAENIHPALYWVDSLTGGRRAMQDCHRRMDALVQDLVDDHEQRLNKLSPEELDEYEPRDFMDSLLLLRGKENGHHVTDRNLKAISMVSTRQ